MGQPKSTNWKVYGTVKEHKLESLWYNQTPQNTLTQIVAKKTLHTRWFMTEPKMDVLVVQESRSCE